MITITKNEIFAERCQRFIRWTRRVLLMSGVLALSYVGLTLLDARIYQEHAKSTLERQIHAQGAHETGLPKPTVREGDVLGRIEIPRIGVSVIVLQGTTARTLRLGVGHIEGTALPGEPGTSESPDTAIPIFVV